MRHTPSTMTPLRCIAHPVLGKDAIQLVTYRMRRGALRKRSGSSSDHLDRYGVAAAIFASCPCPATSCSTHDSLTSSVASGYDGFAAQ